MASELVPDESHHGFRADESGADCQRRASSGQIHKIRNVVTRAPCGMEPLDATVVGLLESSTCSVSSCKQRSLTE